MKKFVFLLVALALLLGSAVKAADVKVNYGTPTIDGKLDDIYKTSASVKLSTAKLAAKDMTECEVSAVGYYLWDEKYVYLCVVVNDKTLTTRGESYCTTASKNNPWQNDVVEAYYNIGDGVYKIALDAYGYKLFGAKIVSGTDYTPAAGILGKATKGTDTYTVEFAVPASLKAGGSVGFSVQVCDIKKAEGEPYYAAGIQKADTTFTLGEKPAATTAKPVATTAKAAAATAKAAAPQTADPTAAFVLAAVGTAAAPALALSRKKTRINTQTAGKRYK